MNPYILVTADSKNDGPVLFFKITFRHCNCFLSSVVTDGNDGNGLKLEKLIQLMLLPHESVYF